MCELRVPTIVARTVAKRPSSAAAVLLILPAEMRLAEANRTEPSLLAAQLITITCYNNMFTL
jgi:hypothetical protein